MRAFAWSIMVLCCVASVAWSDDEISTTTDERSTEEKTVTIDGRDLALAYEGEAEGEAIREFIPRDETLETWTRLAAIREYPELNDPAEVVKVVIKRLEEHDPPIHYDLLENSKTGESVLDFTMLEVDKSFVEFNVFCFRKQAGGGITSYQYAVRAYGDDVVDFIDGLDAEQRMKYVVATLQFTADQNGGTREEPADSDQAPAVESDRGDGDND